jgi:nitrogen fixation/metabolism regulation signal transduction histidine kinase
MLFAYLFFIHKYPAAQLNLFLLLIAQNVLLVYYLNKTNRDLAHFFSSVSNSDSTIVFNNENKDKSYSSLYKQLNNVNSIIEQARIEKIGQFEYLKQVVEHVGVGILSFDDLKVQFFNTAGKDILRISKLNTIIDLDTIYPGFSQKLQNIKPNNQQLLVIKNKEIELNLSVKLVEMVIGAKTIKLFAFQNIHSELEAQELDSWQKIIRVLTHEIMNSVSPINSATNSISRLFLDNEIVIKPKEINQDTINKTLKGMKIIEQRSAGMLSFVQKFRDLTLLPEPQKTEIKVQDLYQTIETLFIKDIKLNNIEIKFNTTPSNLKINADKTQIEQLIINLIKNSIESIIIIANPKIEIDAYLNEKNRTIISIQDNGPGISPDLLENIFIPFFTTKEKGSGIGLSLSRQIMHLHNGNISVKSEPNVETIFTLQF